MGVATLFTKADVLNSHNIKKQKETKRPAFEGDNDRSIVAAIKKTKQQASNDFEYYKTYKETDFTNEQNFSSIIYQIMLVLLPYFVFKITSGLLDFESILLYFLVSTKKGKDLLAQANLYSTEGVSWCEAIVFKAICNADISIGSYGRFIGCLEESSKSDTSRNKKKARHFLPSLSTITKYSSSLHQVLDINHAADSEGLYWRIFCSSIELNDRTFRYATLQNAELFLFSFIRYHEMIIGEYIFFVKIRCTVDGSPLEGACTAYDIVLIHPKIDPFCARNYISVIIAEPKEEIAFKLNIWDFSRQLMRITQLKYSVPNEETRIIPVKFITNPDKGAFNKIIDVEKVTPICDPIFNLVNLYCLLSMIFNTDNSLILPLIPTIRGDCNNDSNKAKGQANLAKVMEIKKIMPETLPYYHNIPTKSQIFTDFQLDEDSIFLIEKFIIKKPQTDYLCCMFCYLTKQTKRIALKYPDLCTWKWYRSNESSSNALGWPFKSFSWCLSHDIRACGQNLIEEEVGQIEEDRQYFAKLFSSESPIASLKCGSKKLINEQLDANLVSEFEFCQWSVFELKVKEEKKKNKTGTELRTSSVKLIYDQILFKQIDKIIMTIDVWYPHWLTYRENKQLQVCQSLNNNQSFEDCTNEEHSKRGTYKPKNYEHIWKALQKTYITLRQPKSKWLEWKKTGYQEPLLIFKNLNKVWIKDILGRISEYLHIHQHADIVFDEVEESFVTTSNIGSESKNSLRRKRHVSFGVNGGLRHPCDDSLYYDSKRILNELKILAETPNIIARQDEIKRKQVSEKEKLTQPKKKRKSETTTQPNPISSTNSSINYINPSLLQPLLPDNFNSITLHNQHSFSPPIYIHPLQLQPPLTNNLTFSQFNPSQNSNNQPTSPYQPSSPFSFFSSSNPSPNSFL